jgi:hypothetical protein
LLAETDVVFVIVADCVELEGVVVFALVVGTVELVYPEIVEFEDDANVEFEGVVVLVFA